MRIELLHLPNAYPIQSLFCSMATPSVTIPSSQSAYAPILTVPIPIQQLYEVKHTPMHGYNMVHRLFNS